MLIYLSEKPQRLIFRYIVNLLQIAFYFFVCLTLTFKYLGCSGNFFLVYDCMNDGADILQALSQSQVEQLCVGI